MKALIQLKEAIKTKLEDQKWKHKIRRIHQKNRLLRQFKISKTTMRNIEELWTGHSLKIDVKWHQAYMAVNGMEDHRYIPENIFYLVLEPMMNEPTLSRAYGDKNLYSRLFPDAPLAETLLRNMHGKYYSREYTPLTPFEACETLKNHEGDLVIKPSIHSGGGKNVKWMRVSERQIFLDGCEVSMNDLEKHYGKNFIIDRKINQYPAINQVYSHSVNTVRIMTLRHQEEIVVASAVLRFGNAGKNVDNQSSGGIACGIGSDGKLNSFAIDGFFKKYHRHPHTGESFDHITIPRYSQLKELVITQHEKLHYFDLASWDIAIDDRGEAVLIEVNLRSQGINIHQLNNGPLFGDLTEKILQETLGR